MKGYTQVGIPQAIAEEIRNIMGLLGYRSVSEFVIEGTRQYVTLKTLEYERRIAELADRRARTEPAAHEKGEESVEHQW